VPEDDKSKVRTGVRWHTGASDELLAERLGPGRTPSAAVDMVRRHGATHTNYELADMFNAAGLCTGKNLMFTAKHVQTIRATYTIYAPRAQSRYARARSASKQPRHSWASPRRGLQLAT
jgi:hypothetical protein